MVGVVAGRCSCALTAGSARAADECKGLRLPAGRGAVGGRAVRRRGLGARLPDPRVHRRRHGRAGGGPRLDVSFRGDTGSPVAPGVTTHRSLIFHAQRTSHGRRDDELPAVHRLHPEQRQRRACADGLRRDRDGFQAAQPLFSVVVTLPSCAGAPGRSGRVPAPARGSSAPPSLSASTRRCLRLRPSAALSASGARSGGRRRRARQRHGCGRAPGAVQLRALCTRAR